MLIGLAPRRDIREIFLFHEIYNLHSYTKARDSTRQDFRHNLSPINSGFNSCLLLLGAIRERTQQDGWKTPDSRMTKLLKFCRYWHLNRMLANGPKETNFFQTSMVCFSVS